MSSFDINSNKISKMAFNDGVFKIKKTTQNLFPDMISKTTT